VEISQIRYFIALCKELNFTRAAMRCGVSQPSLSNGIRALERELGGPLFDRSAIALTPLGKQVLPDLIGVIANIERVRRKAVGARRSRARRTLAIEPSRRFLIALSLNADESSATPSLNVGSPQETRV
jgi:DNA-binding transcriptional LysR family regulator